MWLPSLDRPQSAKSNLNVENAFFTIARDIRQRLTEATEATKPEVGCHSPALVSLFGTSSDHNAVAWVEQSSANIVIKASSLTKTNPKSSCCSGN